jgi:hypothetical protein
MNGLVDNDVLVKGSCYRLLRELVGTVGGVSPRCGFLGAARFVVPKIINRHKLRGDVRQAHAAFSDFLAQHDPVEPTATEQRLAGELEAKAQAMALSLDAGESQLTAIAVCRAIPILLTGDKRAVVAVERLREKTPELEWIDGRLRCLEQAMQLLLDGNAPGAIRAAVCAEPAIDKALTICFSCLSPDAAVESIYEGLKSYVEDLRSRARQVLAT